MKLYLISLSVGILVGMIYALLEVRSPAPPVVALVGLLGILIGEQVVPLAKLLIARESVSVSWLWSECSPHILGELPQRQKRSTREVDLSRSDRA